MRYLLKYKGKYRVLAHYDQNTNDFPRDSSGNIDSSFDDLYIPCRKGQIYHYGKVDKKSVLVAYIKSLKVGRNIIKKLNLINESIIIDTEEGDFEVFIKFNAKYMDIVAAPDIMGAKTYGCDISPFSVRNLSKRKYIIPQEDLDKYTHFIKVIDVKQNIHIIKKLFTDFDKVIERRFKKTDKKFNLRAEKKTRMLKGKEFIHDIGMWDEFIEFTRKEIAKCEI